MLNKLKISKNIKNLCKEKNEQKRLNIIKALFGSNDPRAIEPLIRALDDNSGVIRMSVIKTLSSYSGKQVIEALIKHFKQLEKNYIAKEERLAIISALQNFNDDIVKEALFLELANECSQVRKAAAVGLKNLGQPEWISFVWGNDRDFIRLGQCGHMKVCRPLLKEMRNPSGCKRAATVSALKQLGWEPSSPQERVEFALAQFKVDQAANEGPMAIDLIAKYLYEMKNLPYNFSKRKVAEILIRFGDAAIDALITALNKSSIDAAWALGELSVKRAIPNLIEVLKCGGVEMVKEALIALSRIGGESIVKQAVPNLIKLLNCEDKETVKEALIALKRIGDLSSLGPMKSILLSSRNDKQKKWAMGYLIDAIIHLDPNPDIHELKIDFYPDSLDAHILSKNKNKGIAMKLLIDIFEETVVRIKKLDDRGYGFNHWHLVDPLVDFGEPRVLSILLQLMNMKKLVKKATEKIYNFLKRHSSLAKLEDLRKILIYDDILTYHLSANESMWDEEGYLEVNCTRIKKLARDELDRRDN
jgi:HEAT repeat protein